MPRRLPPYVQRERSRHFARTKKFVYYVRLDRSKPRVRLRAEYGTEAFRAEYNAALLGAGAPPSVAPLPAAPPDEIVQGTLRWAVDLYQRSSAWSPGLSNATRRQRSNILKHVLATGGNALLVDITHEHVRSGFERRKDTPAAARNYMETMRGLFKWAVKDAKLVKVDPTTGISVPRIKSGGFEMWEDEDIAAYEHRWPRGTRERVAFDVLLYTGLRRGDAVRLGRPHVRNGIARIKTEKGSKNGQGGVDVTIKLAPELLATLEAGPCGELTFIAGERGRPRVKESFGEWFRAACHAADVRKSAHGIRKAAATRAAMNGATERELDAMFGWTDGKMASYYTRKADRERLAISAGDKLQKRNEV